jgi:hypothetical protein
MAKHRRTFCTMRTKQTPSHACCTTRLLNVQKPCDYWWHQNAIVKNIIRFLNLSQLLGFLCNIHSTSLKFLYPTFSRKSSSFASFSCLIEATKTGMGRFLEIPKLAGFTFSFFTSSASLMSEQPRICAHLLSHSNRRLTWQTR